MVGVVHWRLRKPRSITILHQVIRRGLTTITKVTRVLAKAGSSALVDVVPYAACRHTRLGSMDTPGYDPPCDHRLPPAGQTCWFSRRDEAACWLCRRRALNGNKYTNARADDRRACSGPRRGSGSLKANPSAERGPPPVRSHRLDVASGRETKSERAGVGEEEFAPP